ncbi:hypothetical protein [Moraxella lacunata]|uniref:hypothetical protein n=1 Tax=Moraxella lacunata TaxID=477 RepID=UPI003EDEEE76
MSVSTQTHSQDKPKRTRKKKDPADVALDVQVGDVSAVSDTADQPKSTKAKVKADQNKPKPVRSKTPKILTIKPKAKPTIQLPSQNAPAKKRSRQTSAKKLTHSRAMSQPRMSGADHVLVPKKPFWNLLKWRVARSSCEK